MGDRQVVQEALEFLAVHVALLLNAIAILMVAFGAVEALVGILRAMIRRGSNSDKRMVWLEFARWLVAGLTFQLGADIVETTVAPGWEDVGRVAAIAAIRTALTFFLDRDIGDMREYQNQRRRERGEKDA